MHEVITRLVITRWIVKMIHTIVLINIHDFLRLTQSPSRLHSRIDSELRNNNDEIGRKKDLSSLY